MRRRWAVLGLTLLISGCLANRHNEILSVKGVWLAARPEVSYTVLDFADSTAVFDNRGDTINRFRYTIDQPRRELVLTDPFGKRKAALLLKATADSLVFDCLWDLNTVQRFYRSKK